MLLQPGSVSETPEFIGGVITRKLAGGGDAYRSFE